MHVIVFVGSTFILVILARFAAFIGADSIDDGIGLLFSYGWVIYYFATIIPTLAITTRRLHDSNHSGWWIFINIVPIIGPFVIFVFTCLSSVDENNQYGDVQI